jgi:hypothetical protein
MVYTAIPFDHESYPINFAQMPSGGPGHKEERGYSEDGDFVS